MVSRASPPVIRKPAFYNTGSKYALSTDQPLSFEVYRNFRRRLMNATPQFLGNSTAVVSGTGVAIVTLPNLYLHIGTTVASTAGRYIITQLTSLAGYAAVNWNRKLFLAFRLVPDTAVPTNDTTTRFLITQSAAIGALAANGLGIKVVGTTLSLVSYGAGASEVAVDAGVTVVVSDPIHILIEHDPASAIRLYVNGVLKATQSTAANIPAGEAANDYYLYWSMARAGSDATDRGMQFGCVELAQEH